MRNTTNNKEKALLVSLLMRGEYLDEIKEQLKELSRLCNTAGATCVDAIIQSKEQPDPATFIGKGKLNTIKNQAKELNCSLLIFNNDISPAQLKNIQNIVNDNIKVLDRTGLILDIFTKNAKTKEAKTQVELAHLEYFLPRLTRQWTHLERQMGGIGTRAGAGETQIEVDRRLIRNKITKLKKELIKIQKQRITQNKTRNATYRVALVGYTNAGKSTLMNKLTDSDVLVQDKLFATLDTTTRKMRIDSNLNVLLSDTVGFIRNIPHNLIASFRSTLSEVNNVDMLLKVFDISSPNINQHINTVEEVLSSMNVKDKNTIFVFNKIDLIKDNNILNGLRKRYNDAIFISTLKSIGIDDLIFNIKNIVTSEYVNEKIYLNYNQTKALDQIYKLSNVLSQKSEENRIELEVNISKNSLKIIKDILKG